MRGLRAAVAGIASAGLLMFGAAPAEAAPSVLAIEGEMRIGCFGCGVYGPDGNSAAFTISGLLGPEIVVEGTGYMTFTVRGSGGLGCVVSWMLEGEVHIDTTLQSIDSPVTVVFNGPVGYMYVHDLPLQGAVEFAVTNPVGNPCHNAVDAHFSGVLGGA